MAKRYFIREELEGGQVFIQRYDRYHEKDEVLYFADRMWDQYISDNEKKHIRSFCLMMTENPDKDMIEPYDSFVVKQYK